MSEVKESWDIPIEEFEWRVQRSVEVKGEWKGIYVAYPDARTVAKHLDRIFSPGGWSDTYEITQDGKAVVCTLKLLIEGNWIVKTDIGTMTDIESHKGGFSDAFKRAAAKAGIGRNAYEIPEIWGPVDVRGDKKYAPRMVGDITLQEYLVDRAYKALTADPSEHRPAPVTSSPEVKSEPTPEYEVSDLEWQAFIVEFKGLPEEGQNTIKSWWNDNGTGTTNPARDIDRETFRKLANETHTLAVASQLGAEVVDGDPF